MRYDWPKAGEWVRPIRKGYRMACCDCGQVHKVDFRVRNRRVEFRVFAFPRATAQMRRAMKRNKEGVFSP